ncbi:N-acyl homoserine lactonase family protein [Rhodococcus sp. LB1]|uniref:N-acyl homoserine lactonase family protein n=1 Tax=Rhodococcus sp. LB1 TaxID=1807499 RepID=UPI000779FB92|nr:N-acyl homoserine lactonase family protein [Rhodococcus sp. LB1]KXX59105.1 hypothetical protein AZG88_42635 [Rhodococcus sp. LB1]
MSVSLYAMTCGEITIPFNFLRQDEPGVIRVPMGSYLIVHPRGQVVFDTGLNPLLLSDYDNYVTANAKNDRTFHFSPQAQISSRLTTAGFDPDAISFVVNSHLHHDHCGGNALLPNAEVLVQSLEWKHAVQQPGDRMAYRQVDFDTGQPVRLLDGEFDVFGDGSVLCVPTYGHTPGHQSLLVNTDRGRYLLCGDACYLDRTLDDFHLPGILADPEQTLDVLHRIRAMRDSGTQVMVGHDPESWTSVPQAPDRLG